MANGKKLAVFDAVRSLDVQEARRMRFPRPGVQIAQQFTGEGPLMPPVEGMVADSPYVRLIYPPWVEKLPESRDFNVQDFNLTLAAGAGAQVQGPSFQIPESQVGWLQSVGLYVLTPTAGTSVTLIVRIDQGPVPGYDNLQNPPGIANFLLFPLEDEIRVRLPNHCTVDCIIRNNNANGPWTVGALLGGWYHSQSAELRQWGPIS